MYYVLPCEIVLRAPLWLDLVPLIRRALHRHHPSSLVNLGLSSRNLLDCRPDDLSVMLVFFFHFFDLLSQLSELART